MTIIDTGSGLLFWAILYTETKSIASKRKKCTCILYFYRVLGKRNNVGAISPQKSA